MAASTDGLWNEPQGAVPDLFGLPADIPALLDALLAQPPRRVYPAWGLAAPGPAATVTGSPRLVCVLGGTASMLVPQGDRRQRIDVEAGEAVFVHHLAWNEQTDRCAKVFLTIDSKQDRLRYYLRRTAGPGAVPAASHLAWCKHPPDAVTWAVIHALELCLQQDDPALLTHQTAALLHLLAREWQRPDVIQAGEHWARLHDWVLEHVCQDIDRAAAAQAVGLAEKRVTELFRQHTGMGFSAFCRRQRIDRACQLLRESELSVAAIGQRCGFSQAAYFSVVFRRVMGESPGQWRARYRK